MTTLKNLLIKDYHTMKKQLFIPLWITLGLYAVFFVSIIIAVTKGNGNVMSFGIPMEMLQNADLHSAISFGLQSGLFLGFLGFIFGIPMAILSSVLLNSDVKHKCELFHRSQPVSVWANTASRYLTGIGGFVALSFLVGLAQLIVVNLLLTILTPLLVNWWLAFNGFLLSWLHLSISLVVLGSLCFLLSGIFKDNALGKGVLVIAVIDLSVLIVNYFLKLDIPSLSKALFKLVYSNIADFTNMFPTMQYGIVVGANGSTTGDISAFTLPQGLLSGLYASVFTWATLGKLALCVLLYVVATYVYKKREVQF